MDRDLGELLARKLSQDPNCAACGVKAVTVRIVETPNTETGDPMDALISLQSLCGLHADIEDVADTP